jgi:hypothetical protein
MVMMMDVGKVGVPRSERRGMTMREKRDLSGWNEVVKFCPS